MTAALIAVLASDGHPERDAWVDEQARTPLVDLGVPVSDDTYHGVWLTPPPEQTRIHLFALAEDLPAIERIGFVRADQ